MAETNVQEVNPEDLRGALAQTIEDRMRELRDSDKQWYICDRLNDTGHMINFRDSLFHYRNGFVLVERLYDAGVVQFETRKVPQYSEEDAKVYQGFLEYTRSLPDMKDISLEDSEKIKSDVEEWQKKLSTMEPPMVETKIPYYEMEYGENPKILLSPLKDQSDEYLKNFSFISADFIFCYFQAMILLPGNNGFAIRGVEGKKYTDIVANFIP